MMTYLNKIYICHILIIHYVAWARTPLIEISIDDLCNRNPNSLIGSDIPII